MPLPPRLHEKYIKQFEVLIAEGQSILDNPRPQVVDRDVYDEPVAPGLGFGQETHTYIDAPRFQLWQRRWGTLLGQVVPPTNPSHTNIKEFCNYGADLSTCAEMLAMLRAFKSDYEGGFLDDLGLTIRAALAEDYMGQAEMLLRDNYHVPAAVLAGAVLEDALRRLCEIKGIPITKPNGERKAINGLNDELYRIKVYETATMHQIQAWADIRNDCAHGSGHKVKAEDVKQMLLGVQVFVAEYLR